MKFTRNICTIILVLLIGACATGGSGPSNPQQAVFVVKQNYDLALSVAVAYVTLPDCTPGVIVCSTPNNRARVKQAKDVASPAMAAAEAAVRDPSFDSSTTNAVLASARAAQAALTAIVATLPVKK